MSDEPTATFEAPPGVPAEAERLEPGPEEMRRLAEAALERIVEHVRSLPEQPAGGVPGGVELARELAGPMPEGGAAPEELLDLLFDEVIPRSFNAASPGYLGFVPGGGLFASAVADFVAAATNRYTGVFAAAPAMLQLEGNVVRWLAEIVGYGEGAGGLLTSGGSLAAFGAVVTARRERFGDDFLSGTVYVSDQAHHSIAKAAVLAGLPPGNVRTVETDERFRIRLDRLREAVARDRRRGMTPFLVAGNAGTVNTGAVDPLRELAAVAAEERLWFHVDGAYGACFAMTGRGRRVLDGIELADSVVLDPHKGLFVPYGTGALLVRDAAALRRAHAFGADYLPEDVADDAGVREPYDPHLLGPELSRHYRGLRVWLPFKLYGAEAFRRALDEKLELARWAAEALRRLEHVRIVAEPELSLLAFRVEPPPPPGGADPERESDRLDRLNRQVVERVNRRGRVFLTGTTARRRYLVRLCILSVRTHGATVEQAVEDVAAAVAEVTGK